MQKESTSPSIPNELRLLGKSLALTIVSCHVRIRDCFSRTLAISRVVVASASSLDANLSCLEGVPKSASASNSNGVEIDTGGVVACIVNVVIVRVVVVAVVVVGVAGGLALLLVCLSLSSACEICASEFPQLPKDRGTVLPLLFMVPSFVSQCAWRAAGLHFVTSLDEVPGSISNIGEGTTTSLAPCRSFGAGGGVEACSSSVTPAASVWLDGKVAAGRCSLGCMLRSASNSLYSADAALEESLVTLVSSAVELPPTSCSALLRSS
mmetsp:Transcript_121624/g.242292  ORF Transcript_121624/g.242292 Transcript_121624/m.242292 type:complete len:266 (-) Transcript_121624:528-1325(-)